MKKILGITLILLFSTKVSMAQADTSQRDPLTALDHERFFRIGFKGTVILNKLPGYTYNDGFNYNYQLGMFLQFNYTKRFGFQPEINLIQATSTFENDITDVTSDLFQGSDQNNSKYNFLEVAGLLNINMGDSRHVKLQVGPSFGFYLNGIPKTIPDVNVLQYKNTTIGMLGGFWLQLPIINFGGRYHYRFNRTENKFTAQKGENQAIEIFAGITI